MNSLTKQLHKFYQEPIREAESVIILYISLFCLILNLLLLFVEISNLERETRATDVTKRKIKITNHRCAHRIGYLLSKPFFLVMPSFTPYATIIIGRGKAWKKKRTGFNHVMHLIK